MTAAEPEDLSVAPSESKRLWLAWLGGPVTFAVASHAYELWDDERLAEPVLALTWIAAIIGHVASGPGVTALLRSGDDRHHSGRLPDPRRFCLGLHWIALGVLALMTIMQVPILHLALRDIIAWNAAAFLAIAVVIACIEADRQTMQSG